jgi:amino acid transporter
MKQRSIGLLSATFLGISSIIGSGWLFAPYKAAQVAGPAAIYSWIIAAVIIGLLALCFAELASLYPRRGLSAIIPTLSHNRFFGFPFAIANWLGIVAVIALEATATIQYLINLFPNLEHLFYSHAELTNSGIGLALILIFLFFIVNFWGASVLAKTNNILTVLKIIVPVVVAVAIIIAAFHPKNFTVVHHSFMPYGFKSVVSAILSTGIIIAFNGFQTVIAFSSEVKKPHITIPYSIVIAISFCLGVYLLLQVAFIGALPDGSLSHGWTSLSYSAPMVEISTMLGLGIITTIIYFGATISPSGTAIAFTGTSTRMFTAMSRNQQMPKYFDKVHPKFGVSRRSLIANTLLGTLFLALFRSWGQLAEVLSLFHVIAYLPIPIALWVLRDNISADKYTFRVPFGKPIAILIFTLFSVLFTMANLKTVVNIMIIFACMQAVFISLNVKNIKDFISAIKQCYLLVLYFIGLLMLTFLSPNNHPSSNSLVFYMLATIFSILAFLMLIRTERNDAELVTSAVKIYD